MTRGTRWVVVEVVGVFGAVRVVGWGEAGEAAELGCGLADGVGVGRGFAGRGLGDAGEGVDGGGECCGDGEAGLELGDGAHGAVDGLGEGGGDPVGEVFDGQAEALGDVERAGGGVEELGEDCVRVHGPSVAGESVGGKGEWGEVHEFARKRGCWGEIVVVGGRVGTARGTGEVGERWEEGEAVTRGTRGGGDGTGHGGGGGEDGGGGGP